MLDSLRDRPHWALWRPYCSCSRWYLQQPPPGTHHRTLSQLLTSSGLITNGTAYFSPPPLSSTRPLVDSVCHGLREGLRCHPLADLLPQHPPPWTTHRPQTRPPPNWTHPRWIQHLNPEIRVTDTMSFYYENVYVTLDPWTIEATVQLQPTGMDPHVWIERRLQIADVGFAAIDSTLSPAPLDELGIVRHPDMERISAWLRRSVVPGSSLWHRRGEYRTARYLTTHTPVDDLLGDVDADVLLYHTAKRPHIRLWEGYRAHSLAF